VRGWSAKLSKPVFPRGSEPLYTLADARAFIAGLPNRACDRPPWRETVNLLLTAAGDGSGASIARATEALKLAVFREYRPDVGNVNAAHRRRRSPDRSKAAG
jgi:hypothetical protein